MVVPALVAMAFAGCVTEHSRSEQVSLGLLAGIRTVVLGTGGSARAVNFQGLPRSPASLLLLTPDAEPILVDPWPGVLEHAAAVRRHRSGSTRPAPPRAVLVTHTSGATSAALREIAALAQAAIIPVFGAARVLADLQRQGALPVERLEPRVLEPGVATRVVDGLDLEATLVAPGAEADAACGLRLRGTRGTLLYMPSGALPERAERRDALLRGADVALLDGSRIGRGDDPAQIIERAARSGVLPERIRFTSLTLEDPGLPAQFLPHAGSFATDGDEFWL